MNTLCIEIVDSQYFVTGTWERSIRLWKQNSPKLLRVLMEMDQMCYSLSIMKDKCHILAGYNCGYIIQWNLCNGQQIQKFRPHWGRINKLIYLFNNIITTVSADGSLKILSFDKNQFEQVTNLQIKSELNCGCKLKNGNLVVGTQEGQIYLLE